MQHLCAVGKSLGRVPRFTWSFQTPPNAVWCLHHLELSLDLCWVPRESL